MLDRLNFEQTYSVGRAWTGQLETRGRGTVGIVVGGAVVAGLEVCRRLGETFDWQLWTPAVS